LKRRPPALLAAFFFLRRASSKFLLITFLYSSDKQQRAMKRIAHSETESARAGLKKAGRARIPHNLKPHIP